MDERVDAGEPTARDVRTIGARTAARIESATDVLTALLANAAPVSRELTPDVVNLNQLLRALREIYELNIWADGTELYLRDLFGEASSERMYRILGDVITRTDLREIFAFQEPLTALAVEQLGEARTALADVPGETLPDLAASSIATWSERLDVFASLARIRRHEAEAASGASHVKQLAGDAAESELGRHFREFGRRERRAAAILMGTVIALATLLTLFTSWTLAIHGGAASWLELARKLALTLPGAALAAYLAREAGHRRDNADWAQALEIQLRTIGGFTDPLQDATRNEIRAAFGRYLFGARSAGPENSPALTSVVKPEILVDLAKVIMQANTPGRDKP